MCTTSPIFILTLILNLTNISLFAPLLWSSLLTHTHSWDLHIDKKVRPTLVQEPLILWFNSYFYVQLHPCSYSCSYPLLYSKHGGHNQVYTPHHSSAPTSYTLPSQTGSQKSIHTPQQVPSITKCSSTKYHTVAASCETDWNAAHNTHNQHLQDTWHPALRGYRDTLGQLYNTNKHMNKGQTLFSMSHLNLQMS